jgi:N-acetylglucosaminyldiphosphoundecaprenol N-acetyl-beta-D-mannosaminyltransferase
MPTTQAVFVEPAIKPDRVRIGCSNVDAVTYEEALDRLVELAENPLETSQVVTPNAQHIVLLERDPHLRRIYSEAALVVPDGISLVFAARLLGKPLKGRVTGVDLFQGLCARAAERGLGVFLLGGRRGAVEETAARLKSSYPELNVLGTYCPPYGFHLHEEGLNEVARAILAARPHILFVALGAPKQEYWIYEHGKKLGVPLSIGIGGSFEMVSGMTRRAPQWLQLLGLEWLFRLAIEPRRLWKRYLIGNLQFLAILCRQAYAEREDPTVPQGAKAGRV